MRRVWVRRDIDAPAPAIWDMLVRLDMWPRWGPTVRRATLDGDQLTRGARGTVTTILGVELPFEITVYDDGERWAWKVAGVAATDHVVEALGPGRSRASFGVPWPAAPYLGVCRSALKRLDTLATAEQVRT